MSAFLVVCIADIPSEVLTAFQKQSTSAKNAPESSSFPTGFKDATPETLQNFMAENVVGRHKFPDYRGSIAWNEFVVPDPRSAEDKTTCLVYHHVQRMPEDSADDEWDEEKLIYEWKVWRVKFLMAWWLITGLNNNDEAMFDVMEDENNTYTD
ncbi:hypothetical protein DID88_008198 [Monilinia fructigena]|uniref:Uncharacterized protein n=1 Tax=Monilinia fructigena TaxID=38457 RepID=A0A395J716_9HELO|nr:hypothetical protein DID88_008198 [Monilinia fructigena]